MISHHAASLLGDRWRQGAISDAGGKSGLYRAAQGLTTLTRKCRNSGTEKMSRALSLRPGTGGLRGAAGVKIAKLCAEQDQIGMLKKRGPRKASGSDRLSLAVMPGLEE